MIMHSPVTTDMHDRLILRRLAEQVAAIAAQPIQEERRRLWRAFHRLEPERPMLYVETGMPGWEILSAELECRTPFARQYEFELRRQLWQDEIGDDAVVEPWITVSAQYVVPAEGHWGISAKTTPATESGGAWHSTPAIRDLDDVRRMIVPEHVVDEAATEAAAGRLQDLVGDLLPVNVSRKPFMSVWGSHISGDLGQLRGIETVMLDMLDHPEWLHALLACMRDGILKVHREAEAAGHWSLGDHENQSVPYADELPAPRANSGPVPMKGLWGLMAAQELTLISPEMHDEFMLHYQLPICTLFGLVAYGCCEDLSRKIGILRQIPNLRRIAVTPWADVARSAEAMGSDYCASWRPSPVDTVCMGFDLERVRTIVREGLATFRRHGCPVEINLKDVKTLQGDKARLRQFVEVCRQEIDGRGVV
jgi:hypothetical protein